jgi:hypothetical protein
VNVAIANDNYRDFGYCVLEHYGISLRLPPGISLGAYIMEGYSMKKTQVARIVRAMTKQGRTLAHIDSGYVELMNHAARVIIAAQSTTDTPTTVPLDLVADLVADSCVVSGNTVTLGTVTRSFIASDRDITSEAIIHPGGGFSVSGTASAWIAGAAGTDKSMPMLLNIFARDGYLMATDRFRAHSVPCPDDARGAIPASLLVAFGDCDLAFDDSGAWFVSGDGFQSTGTVYGEAPGLHRIITSALSDANRVQLGVDLLALITSAGKLPKQTSLTIDATGATFQAPGGFLVTIPAPAPAMPVKVDPAFITSAGIGEWSIVESMKPLIARDGERLALVMPQR